MDVSDEEEEDDEGGGCAAVEGDQPAPEVILSD